MAKTMARIENGIVVNIEWYADRMEDTDILKNVEDRRVGVGDSYSDGKFYRDGEEILKDSDILAQYKQALFEIETALGV